MDTREGPSGVPGILRDLGARVELRLLDVADYVIGDRAIERKTIDDFASSLFSGRLFEQAKRLVESYVSPVMVIEGDLRTALQKVSRREFFGDHWFRLFCNMKYGHSSRQISNIPQNSSLPMRSIFPEGGEGSHHSLPGSHEYRQMLRLNY